MKTIVVALLSTIVVPIIACTQPTSVAAPSVQQDNEPAYAQPLSGEQIHRIGDYGKLWCVLHLFHPNMAYNTINADSLFTDNIGDLLQNPSAENFKKSVQKMINGLQDPYTTIEENSRGNNSVQLPDEPLLTWLQDSIALVNLDDTFMMNNAASNITYSFSSLMETLRHARGIVLDIRKSHANNNDYYSWDFMKLLVSNLTSHDITYSSFSFELNKSILSY